MGKTSGAGDRESKLASGWTVESEPAATAPTTAPVGSEARDADPDGTDSGRTLDSRTDTTRADRGGSGDRDGSADGTNDIDAAEPATQMSNGALVVLGVIGGLYLLYTWVWFSWSNYYAAQNTLIAELSGSFGFVLQQITFWSVPAAPALWFLAAYLLNKNAPTWRLALWLLIGAVVLVPLPMFSSIWGA